MSHTTPVNVFQDQHVLVLGLGASGLAMARWCAGKGARVTVADTRPQPPQLAALAAELPLVRFVCAPLDGALLDGDTVHRVLRSPGLSPQQLAPVSIAVCQYSISLKGELDLFSEALAELKSERAYAPKVLAITGTNGKTTVTSLTTQLVQRAGKSVAMAGNIGPTLLDTLAAHLAADTLPEVWVLELSSFQLDGVTGFHPAAATVLNLSQDHLDWHGDMAHYAAAKACIFGREGVLVLNRDDDAVMAMRSQPVKGQAPRTCITFGADSPKRPGDFGIEQAGGMSWLVRALEADETRRKKRDDTEELHIQRLMPTEVLRIHGRHNALNALAALALAASAGCALAPILFGLREYRGEPHRVQSVGFVHGVEYVDDSKGTNVGATVAALKGLGVDRKLVLILGGEGKGQDFSPLADPVGRHARAVVLIGRDAPLIRVALASCGVPMVDTDSMRNAVVRCSELACAGDAVLMSPACASFDMFTHYGHRAQVFVEAVQQLALDAGQTLEVAT